MTYSVIICGDSLIEIGFQTFSLGLKHRILSFSAFLFELMQSLLFLFIFLLDLPMSILDGKILAFFLFEFSRIIIDFPLKGFQLRFIKSRGDRFIDGAVDLEPRVHEIMRLL